MECLFFFFEMIAKDTNFPSRCAAGVCKAVLFLYVTGVIAVALADKKKWSSTFVNKPSLILFYSFSNLFQPQVRKWHGRELQRKPQQWQMNASLLSVKLTLKGNLFDSWIKTTTWVHEVMLWFHCWLGQRKPKQQRKDWNKYRGWQEPSEVVPLKWDSRPLHMWDFSFVYSCCWKALMTF